MNTESEKIARATAKLEYADMRDKLGKIFGDPGVLDSVDMVPEIKQEVNFGHGYDRFPRGGCGGGNSRFRGGYNGTSRGAAGNVADTRTRDDGRYNDHRSQGDRGRCLEGAEGTLPTQVG